MDWIEDQSEGARSNAGFGAVMFGVGLLALALSIRIKAPGLGTNEDPGPAAFPQALAVCLMFGGLLEALRSVGLAKRRGGLKPSAVESNATSRHSATSKPPSGQRWTNDPGVRNVLVLLGALLLYLLAIPWAGFSLVTLIFAAGLMGWLGVRWWMALGFAAGMVGAIHLLFVQLFKVQLPAGVPGLFF